ncbi:Irc4p [Saccharomyces cerevisiae]|nr:Irc4p [Saccharomyces cerevisiae]PTN20076.1 Irc4p [Saccharomyces cerevisiae]
MREYTSKKELKEEIEKKYEKYDAEFETISESQKDEKVETVDRTPSENLSYQLGWVNLLLEWEAKEIAGYNVETPAPGYKWNNLGGLYQSFYKKYGIYSIKEQRAKLREAVNEVYKWISTLPDDELFQAGNRKWATTKAMWPVYKWIHINTVAPFTNFRGKIRKWKRLVPEEQRIKRRKI